MKKRALLLIIVSLFLGCAHNAVKTDTLRKAKSMVWEFKKSDTTFYLLGSIHAATEDMYPLPQVLYDSYDKADIIGVEANILEVDQKAVQALVMSTGTYTDGTTVEDHIKPETVEKLKKTLLEIGVPYGMVKTFKPWMIGMTITQSKIAATGMDITKGIDLHFLNKAVGEGKKIVELEGMESQLALFNSLDENGQEAFLLSALESEADSRDILNGMITSWKQGDLDQLSHIMETAAGANDELKDFYHKLIQERNVNMADKMLEFAEKGGDYFFIVGAAHLPGEEGIISLLSEKGFEVRRMK